MKYILSEKELICLKNKKDKSIKNYEVGCLIGRAKRKLNTLKIPRLVEELSYLKKDQIELLVKKLIYQLYPEEFEKLVKSFNHDLEDSKKVDILMKNFNNLVLKIIKQ